MKKGIDIYNYDRKFEATVRNMRASKITEQNKKLIEKFYNFCFAKGIGKPELSSMSDYFPIISLAVSITSLASLTKSLYKSSSILNSAPYW